MPGEQKEIYYLIGESRALIENSPYLEAFKAQGPGGAAADRPDRRVPRPLAAAATRTSPSRPSTAATRRPTPTPRRSSRSTPRQFKPLLEALKRTLGADVKDVRLSARLKESAAVLVADEYGMSAHMERLLQRMGRGEEVPDDQAGRWS